MLAAFWIVVVDVCVCRVNAGYQIKLRSNFQQFCYCNCYASLSLMRIFKAK